MEIKELEEHVKAAAEGADPVKIMGVIPKHRVDISDLEPYFRALANGAKAKNELQRHQQVRLPAGPCALALFGDQHWGGKVDYQRLFEDTELVANTPFFFAGHTGDLTDNFIIGKLQAVQKNLPTTFQQEVRGGLWWLQTIAPSLLFWLNGNHNHWTMKVSGIDFWRERLGAMDCVCLYDPHQIQFDLVHGDQTYRVVCRHKWKYSSVFNATHGLEVGWERMGLSYDIAIGSHTHIATLCRPFIREGRRRYAVLLGTYKLRDEYARECGFPDHPDDSRGSGAFLFLDGGRLLWVDDIRTAAELLTYYRKAWEHDQKCERKPKPKQKRSRKR